MILTKEERERNHNNGRSKHTEENPPTPRVPCRAPSQKEEVGCSTSSAIPNFEGVAVPWFITGVSSHSADAGTGALNALKCIKAR